MSFGSHAADYKQNKLDLNRLLIPHPEATYFVKMQGNALCREGIFDGDILAVDRTLLPQPGRLAVIETDSEFKVTRLPGRSKEIKLWGMVSAVIRKLK